MPKKRTNKGTKPGSRQPVTSGPALEQLEKVLRFMEQHGLAELDWQSGQERVHLRTHSAVTTGGAYGVSHAIAPSMPAVAPVQLVPPTPLVPPAVEAPKSEAKPAESNQKQILSPFVGTFYRAPSPGAEPYVREGQLVKKGDVLCVIEAMKLMNEIESEYTGKITAVLVENGQPVEFGEPLFIVET